MELISQVIYGIYSGMSKTEVLIASLALLGMIPVIFKIVTRIIANRKAISMLIGGEGASDEKIDELNKKMDSFVTKDEHVKLTDKVMLKLDIILDKIESSDDFLIKQEVNIQDIKKDIDRISQAFLNQISDFKHQLKMHDVYNEQNSQNIKDQLLKMADNISKTLSQIEKIDEFSKNMLPEFRSYHKEISKDLSELSKDLALIERTIQTQINNQNSIKLR